MQLEQFHVLFQLLHVRFESLLAVFFGHRVDDDRQLEVVAMELFPVLLESVDERLSLVVRQLSHRSTPEVLRHVRVILVLRSLHLLLPFQHVRRRLAEVLHRARTYHTVQLGSTVV